MSVIMFTRKNRNPPQTPNNPPLAPRGSEPGASDLTRLLLTIVQLFNYAGFLSLLPEKLRRGGSVKIIVSRLLSLVCLNMVCLIAPAAAQSASDRPQLPLPSSKML